MKKMMYGVAVGALVVGLSMAGAAAANASATLYDNNNNNYTGASYGPANSAANVGTLNDKASSVSASGTYTYWEDAGYLGRKVTLTGSYNSLGAVTTNLHIGETWSDRISSFN